MSLRLTSSALALMAFAMPAMADVTPEEVWQTWLDYFKVSGYEVSEGSRDLAGETLTVKDIKLVSASDEASVEMSIPQVQMQATGDGKVRTVYSDTLPIKLSGKDIDDTTYETNLTISHPGNEMISSGSKDDMTHDYVFPTIDVKLEEFKSGDETTKLPIEVKLSNSTGSIHTKSDGTVNYDYTHKSEGMTFAVVLDSAEEGKGSVKGSIEGLEANGKMAGASDQINMQEDLAAALNNGLTMDGTMKLGPLDVAFDFANQQEGEEQSGNGTYKAENADLTFAMAKEGLKYQVNSGKADAMMQISTVPFPITYGIESATMDLQIPVSKSDTPAPFKVAYSLAGLTLGDEIWNLFDAGKQLPRDPANLDIDVSGSAKVLKDLLDPATMAVAESDDPEAADALPMEATEISINQIAVKALGASIAATGELKPSDAAGMASPVGKITAKYEGVNGLLDKLAAAGLVPQEQLGGVRMMLAMFARPDGGDDKLSTELEFKEGGSVFANGQQVK